MIAFVFSTVYQFMLTKNNLSKYLLKEYTPNEIKNLSLFEANKSGIYSCLGYFAIYFAGQSISFYMTSKVKEK
jgi:hypothetical protein